MALNMYMQNCTDNGGSFLHEMIAKETWSPWNTITDYFVYRPWLFSLVGSSMVGLAGIFPLLVIPIDEGIDLKNEVNSRTLKILLSFAVGGLLGDIFLHLLPEAWESEYHQIAQETNNPQSVSCGLWVLSGFLVFVIVEKLFGLDNNDETDAADTSLSPETIKETVSNSTLDYCPLSALDNELIEDEIKNNNSIMFIKDDSDNVCLKHCENTEQAIFEVQRINHRNLIKNGDCLQILKECGAFSQKNGTMKNYMCDKYTHLCKEYSQNLIKGNNGLYATTPSLKSHPGKTIESRKDKSKHITGYLNLMANVIDNFTHGMAVGGSFLMSFRLGALTTFAILIHEIPHEVGDFAILLRSGFSRWDAARAQLLTASGGIFGALAAVFISGGGVDARTSWILPFTAGGFLHIGMVTILPELLKESSPKESLKQLAALLFGITVMAILTVLCD